MQERGDNVRVLGHLVYHVLSFFVEVLFFVLIIVFMIQCCHASYRFCYEISGSVSVEDAPGKTSVFRVVDSDNMYQVAKRLDAENLIANKFSFYIRTQLMNPNQVRLRTGRYLLNTSMDYEEIINELTMSE